METIRANYSFSYTSNDVQLIQPFLHFQVSCFTSRFSLSSSANHNHQSLLHTHTPLQNSSLSLTRNTYFNSSPKNLLTAASQSFFNDDVSGSTTKVLEDDTSLAIRVKKAIQISPELKGTSLFLIGITSIMKTNLGKLLADVLRYYYFDSDSLVEEAAGGKSAAKSFREKDEKGFRELETEVLNQLSSMGRLVVCTGNNAIQSATNLALLRHGISIWIDVPLDMVAQEIVENEIQFPESEISNSRSHSEVLAQLIALYGKTQSAYSTADATVSLQKVAGELGYDDLDALTTEDMGLEVLEEIEKLLRVKKMIEAAAKPF